MTRLGREFVVGTLVLLFVVVITFATSWIADSHLSKKSRVGSWYSSGDVVLNAIAEDSNSRSRYALYVTLGRIAPGSTVALSLADDFPSPERAVQRLYGFGRADAVTKVESSHVEALEEFDPEPFVVVRSREGDLGIPWMIALDPSGPIVGLPADPTEAMLAVLDASDPLEIEGSPRRFVLVVWNVPLPSSVYDYQLLLVEESLLDRGEDPG